MMPSAETITRIIGHTNWVVANRTARIVERYGEDVVCLSKREYLDVHRRAEIEEFGAPVASLEAAAPALLAACREARAYADLKLVGFRREYPHNHAIVLTAVRLLDQLTDAIAKAEGRA